MSRIGILGGTFNPIHIGHIKLATAAYESLKLNKVLIMPTGISYLKAGTDVLPKEIRAEIVNISIKNYPYLEFSDIEINRDGNTYTYETLLELKDSFPNDEFYYIIGADTLYSMEFWKLPEIIFKNCVIAAMARDDIDYDDMSVKIADLKNRFNANIELINAPKFDISSSYIRDQIKSGNISGIKEFLDTDAYDYIINNKIYLTGR